MSYTPRTDAVAKHYLPTHWPVALGGMEALARELERENNQLKEYVSALEEQLDSYGLKQAQAKAFATVEQPGMNTGPGNRCEVACPNRADAGLNPARGTNQP